MGILLLIHLCCAERQFCHCCQLIWFANDPLVLACGNVTVALALSMCFPFHPPFPLSHAFYTTKWLLLPSVLFVFCLSGAGGVGRILMARLPGSQILQQLLWQVFQWRSLALFLSRQHTYLHHVSERTRLGTAAMLSLFWSPSMRHVHCNMFIFLFFWVIFFRGFIIVYVNWLCQHWSLSLLDTSCTCLYESGFKIFS